MESVVSLTFVALPFPFGYSPCFAIACFLTSLSKQFFWQLLTSCYTELPLKAVDLVENFTLGPVEDAGPVVICVVP